MTDVKTAFPDGKPLHRWQGFQRFTLRRLNQAAMLVGLGYAFFLTLILGLQTEDRSAGLLSVLAVIIFAGGWLGAFLTFWLGNLIIEPLAPTGSVYRELRIYPDAVYIQRRGRNLQTAIERIAFTEFEGVCVAIAGQGILSDRNLGLGRFPAGIVPVTEIPEFKRYTSSWLYLKRRDSRDDICVLARRPGLFSRIFPRKEILSNGINAYNFRVSVAQELATATGLPYLGTYKAAD